MANSGVESISCRDPISSPERPGSTFRAGTSSSGLLPYFDDTTGSAIVFYLSCSLWTICDSSENCFRNFCNSMPFICSSIQEGVYMIDKCVLYVIHQCALYASICVIHQYSLDIICNICVIPQYLGNTPVQYLGQHVYVAA